MITMTKTHKKRLGTILLIVVGIGISVAFALAAILEPTYFFDPAQIVAGKAPTDRVIRMGGLVSQGSVQEDQNSLQVNFTVTDCKYTIPVQYTGILPDLFREGQGIIAEGRMQANGTFLADTVLAKHDENYVPPELADTLKDNACFQSGHGI